MLVAFFFFDVKINSNPELYTVLPSQIFHLPASETPNWNGMLWQIGLLLACFLGNHFIRKSLRWFISQICEKLDLCDIFISVCEKRGNTFISIYTHTHMYTNIYLYNYIKPCLSLSHARTTAGLLA